MCTGLVVIWSVLWRSFQHDLLLQSDVLFCADDQDADEYPECW